MKRISSDEDFDVEVAPNWEVIICLMQVCHSHAELKKGFRISDVERRDSNPGESIEEYFDRFASITLVPSYQ